MADGPNIGFATLQVIPSMRGVQAQMAGQMAGPSAAVGRQAGGTMGTAMGAALKVGLGAAVSGIGAIAGLAKLGGSFDEAFDAIRIGTGATGDALEDLKGSFKTVFSSVPTDMGSASQAVADLNTRLGLTGEPLEALSTQMLELSRITGTDLGSNIESVSRVFNDWGIAAEDQAGSLDSLFRASQATGINVDALSQNMVKFGSPLRQLGFDFDTTAGLLGKFEKEGVNAELVMGSMRIALGKMARDGEPAEETLQRVTEQIANAGSASEANALALELFGARAGPDMAAAIREGRFELGDLYDTIASGEETILGAADETKDFSERWNELKNQALVGLEPLATAVFDALGTGMERLSDWWAANGENVLGFFSRIGEAIGGLATLFRDEGLAGVASALGDWITTNVPIFAEKLLALGAELVNWVAPQIPPLLAELGELLVDVGEWILRDGVPMLVEGVGALASALIDWVVNDAIPGLVGKDGVMWDFLEDFGKWISDDGIEAFLEAGKDLGGALLDGLVEAFKDIPTPLEVLLDALGGDPYVERKIREIEAQGRATGGPVTAGMPYIVGERRPELFIPEQNGTILPFVPDYGTGGGATPLVGSLTVVQQPGEDSVSTAMRELRRFRGLSI